MKDRISIRLSKDVLTAVDRIRDRRQSRSALIREILNEHFHKVDLYQEAAHDLERINRAAELFNSEALDVLEYQFGKLHLSRVRSN